MNIKVVCLFALALTFLVNLPTRAQEECIERTPEPPSQQLRTYQESNLKFSFSLPANYRLSLNSRTKNLVILAIMAPATYEYLRCLIRHQAPVEGPSEMVYVEVRRLEGPNSNLQQTAERYYPWIRQGAPPSPYSNPQQRGLRYERLSTLGNQPVSYLFFFSQEQRLLAAIIGPPSPITLINSIAGNFQFTPNP